MKRILVFILTFLFISKVFPQHDTTFWVTDGYVYGMTQRGTDLIIGGNFDYVGPVNGAVVPVNYQTHEVIPGFPLFNGNIRKIISDDNGGWFICGEFNLPALPGFHNFVHVKSDFTVDSLFRFQMDSIVYDMVAYGSRIYLGGDFEIVNGQSRNFMCAIDKQTGALLPWNPNFNASGTNFKVNALGVWQNYVYAGGEFYNIGGYVRGNLVEIDTLTSAPSAFIANVNDEVTRIVIDHDKLFIAGSFTSVLFQTRYFVAAINLNSHLYTGFDPFYNLVGPPSNTYVSDIVVDSNFIYMCGRFNFIHGMGVNNIAKVNNLTNNVSQWISGGQYDYVTEMEMADGKVFHAAPNSKFPLEYFSISDSTNGNDTINNINISGKMTSINLKNDTLLIGGNFCSLSGPSGPGVLRNNMAAINTVTNVPTSFTVDVNNGIFDVALVNSQIVIAGTFDTVAGQPRKYLAKVDPVTGQPDNWNPIPNRTIDFFAQNENRLYVVGRFDTINGTKQKFITAFDTLNFSLIQQPFTFENGSFISDLNFYDHKIFITGNFDTINSVPRIGIGCYDEIDSTITAFDARMSSSIPSIQGSICLNDKIYIYGEVSQLGDSIRKGIACLDTSLGNATSWNTHFPYAGIVMDAVAYDDSIIFGGSFPVNSQNSKGEQMIIVDTANGDFRLWNEWQNLNLRVDRLYIYANKLFAAGSDLVINGQHRKSIAAWTIKGSPVFIDEIENESSFGKISFSPNPILDCAKLRSDKKLNYPVSIDFRNSLGKNVMKVKLYSEDDSFCIENIPAGTYVLRITDKEKNVHTGKLIKMD